MPPAAVVIIAARVSLCHAGAMRAFGAFAPQLSRRAMSFLTAACPPPFPAPALLLR